MSGVPGTKRERIARTDNIYYNRYHVLPGVLFIYHIIVPYVEKVKKTMATKRTRSYTALDSNGDRRPATAAELLRNAESCMQRTVNSRRPKADEKTQKILWHVKTSVTTTTVTVIAPRYQTPRFLLLEHFPAVAPQHTVKTCLHVNG